MDPSALIATYDFLMALTAWTSEDKEFAVDLANMLARCGDPRCRDRATSLDHRVYTWEVYAVGRAC